MTTPREHQDVAGTLVERHETGLHDRYGRLIQYETTIEALVDPKAPNQPRIWRVWGRQLRDGRSLGRYSVPLHVYTVADAKAMARTLYHRHARYVQRRAALAEVKAAAAEEDLSQLAGRI